MLTGILLQDRITHLRQTYGLGPHTALHLVRLLEAEPNLRVTSGRRTPSRNAAVGGARNSYHLRGRAVDVVGSLADLKHALRHAKNQRVSPGCTGPEEAFIERPGERGQHLHVAW